MTALFCISLDKGFLTYWLYAWHQELIYGIGIFHGV